MLTLAAFKVEWFARQEKLSGSSLKEMLPSRVTPKQQALLEAKKVQLVLFAEGVNKRLAEMGAAKAAGLPVDPSIVHEGDPRMIHG